MGSVREENPSNLVKNDSIRESVERAVTSKKDNMSSLAVHTTSFI